MLVKLITSYAEKLKMTSPTTVLTLAPWVSVQKLGLTLIIAQEAEAGTALATVATIFVIYGNGVVSPRK
jgi:hypothetical protein